jgi:hypothetical protein
MDSSAASLARGGILADPGLWIAAAALLVGLGAGQLLRAFRGGGRHGRPERLRAGRISRSIASLSLGILALTGLFVLADKGALSRVIADGALPWTAALFCAALAAGYRPLSVGLPLALVAAAAIATVRLGLEGWLPIRHAAADGSMEIARLLPYEVGASSFRGQLELPERDSVPVFQDIRLASSSVGLLAEVVELRGPLRLAFELAAPRLAEAALHSPSILLYRVAGLAVPSGASGAAASGASGAEASSTLAFAAPKYIAILDTLLPLPPGGGLGQNVSRNAPSGLAERRRLSSPAVALQALQPESFRLKEDGSSVSTR